MKKTLKSKFTSLKSVNNHKIKSHKTNGVWHIVSKGIEDIFDSLAPIYQMLDEDFLQCDLIDYEFYERWLNGRN